jgi:hypothetical protein
LQDIYVDKQHAVKTPKKTGMRMGLDVVLVTGDSAGCHTKLDKGDGFVF